MVGTLVLWHWPHWIEPVSQLWWPESSRWYAFTSSVGSTFAWPLWGCGALGIGWRVYRKHFECHEPGCTKHGKYVLSSGARCCDDHHPDLDDRDESERGLVHKLNEAHHRRAANHLAAAHRLGGW